MHDIIHTIDIPNTCVVPFAVFEASSEPKCFPVPFGKVVVFRIFLNAAFVPAESIIYSIGGLVYKARGRQIFLYASVLPGEHRRSNIRPAPKVQRAVFRAFGPTYVLKPSWEPKRRPNRTKSI